VYWDGWQALIAALRLDCLDELEPNNVEWVVVLRFLFDFAHESGIERGEEKLGGGKIVCFVVLVVEDKLLRAESLAGCNGVAGVTLDNICHHGRVLRIGEIGIGVHSTPGTMVPDSVLKVNETAGLCKESPNAGTTKVVPLLGGTGMDSWFGDVIVDGA
jgi:hypothetical protein